MFSLSHVDLSFGTTRVLNDVSLELPRGSTTALIGPSGCGKSTLLRLLLGLAQPARGTVRFAGQPVDERSVHEVRRRVGYVIQKGGLFPHMTARENVTLMARHLRMDPERAEKRIAELARLTRFPRDGLERYPSELSGGQNQRVSLMRALMLDPDALLLDEPLGALDPMIRFDLQQELGELFAALGKTVLLVTHDLAEAAELGHTIVLMNAGEIVFRGDLQALLDAPEGSFARRFVRAQRSHLQDRLA